MDDETIPVTARQKDSIIGILDDAPPIAAAEAIELRDAGEQQVEDEIMSFEEPQEAPEDEIIPAETSAEPSESKAIYLEHIQVIEPDRSPDIETVVENEAEPVEVQPVDENAAEAGPAIIETQELLVPPTMEAEQTMMEIEPISAISTEYAIENDPALALTETNTTTEETASADPPTQPDPALLETETVVTTTTTTVTTVIETEPEIEQPVLGASTDADADVDDDQAEHMRRAEQTRLEQGGEEMAKQQPDAEAQEPNPDQSTDPTTTPAEAPAPNGGESPLTEQLEQGQAGSIDPPVTSDPTLNPTNGDLNPDTSQHTVALDAPSEIAPPGMLNESKSPEWQGFAALDEEDARSPEAADHSCKLLSLKPTRTHRNNPEFTEDSALQLAPSAGTSTSANLRRKRKLIMEVVIPVQGKAKGKSKAIKAESPEPATRGRPKSGAASSTRSGSTSKSRPRSRSSVHPRPASAASPSTRRSSVASSTAAPTRKQVVRRPFGSRKKVKKPGKPVPIEHMARSAKVEVVMQKRQGLLRRNGSIASGNNVKFAPTTRASRNEKAESEPDEDEQSHEAQSSDADAEGEVEEGYEDVEEDEEPEPEPKPVRKSGPSKPGPSKPIKRPRRSLDARKTPAKLPEVLTDSGRPKKRRTRR